MGFFGNLFGKSEDSPTHNNKRVNISKNVGVPFKKDLIPILKKDHKNLLKEYQKIAKILSDKKYKTLKKLLKEFKINLEIHNYSEKIQLYTYMKNYYKYEKEFDFIEKMASSAEEVYNDVFAFLKKYEKIEINNQNIELFIQEFGDVGKILQTRIEVEELELYPLYKK